MAAMLLLFLPYTAAMVTALKLYAALGGHGLAATWPNGRALAIPFFLLHLFIPFFVLLDGCQFSIGYSDMVAASISLSTSASAVAIAINHKILNLDFFKILNYKSKFCKKKILNSKKSNHKFVLKFNHFNNSVLLNSRTPEI